MQHPAELVAEVSLGDTHLRIPQTFFFAVDFKAYFFTIKCPNTSYKLREYRVCKTMRMLI